jgi:hypothetical protein
MVWLGSTKAHIGVAGKWVIVKFCMAKSNDPDTADAYKANVSKVCVKDGMNECFNK